MDKKRLARTMLVFMGAFAMFISLSVMAVIELDFRRGLTWLGPALASLCGFFSLSQRLKKLEKLHGLTKVRK